MTSANGNTGFVFGTAAADAASKALADAAYKASKAVLKAKAADKAKEAAWGTNNYKAAAAKAADAWKAEKAIWAEYMAAWAVFNAEHKAARKAA
jgi:hypothetical protein